MTVFAARGDIDSGAVVHRLLGIYLCESNCSCDEFDRHECQRAVLDVAAIRAREGVFLLRDHAVLGLALP